MDKSTEELNSILKNNKDLKSFMLQNEAEFIEDSFSEYLSKLMAEKGIEKSKLILYAQLDKNYGYEIFRGKKLPSRDYVIRIGIALKLSLVELNRLLRIAGKSELYPRNKRDSIIIYAINNQKSLEDCYYLLENMNEENLM